MYQIFWNGIPVGNAEMRKEGMFYRFICYCRLPDKGVYRIVVDDGKNKYNLGICVPEGSKYSCVARVSCSKLNGNNLTFVLTNGDARKGIPIETGKPFAQLDKLINARLHIANGQSEIIIDPIQDPQDSGQNQVHPNKWAQQ